MHKLHGIWQAQMCWPLCEAALQVISIYSCVSRLGLDFSNIGNVSQQRQIPDIVLPYWRSPKIGELILMVLKGLLGFRAQGSRDKSTCSACSSGLVVLNSGRYMKCRSFSVSYKCWISLIRHVGP